MASSTLEWLIKNGLVDGKPEGETNTVWTMILTSFFKLDEGYVNGSEMSLGGGRADLYTAHIVSHFRNERLKFLVVECKAPGRETRDEAWAMGALQLQRYLSGISSGNRKFGAIAVGKCVRFYELNRNGSLEDFQNDGNIYWLDRHCQSVTRKLQYFRDNHLM